ncbi:MAG: hypothetical protein HYX42_00035 [Polaromonas sp.]|uniref:hypothetical protein n=1 Tax=Polaromonas sp. TaxID=1869339 RepID=UPI0025FFCA05|nr:hypothetical protein [Polaromonas sp.]MBI2724617.1 hypothetical protein [Polaromonas sp.]
MKPEIKAKWVKALRSGEYEQAKKYLRTPDGFCCLGVLCDLHAKETGNKWSEDGAYLDDKTHVPQLVCDWSGLVRGGSIEIVVGKNKTWLTDHNDGLNTTPRTFKEIADAIEAQL